MMARIDIVGMYLLLALAALAIGYVALALRRKVPRWDPVDGCDRRGWYKAWPE